jgi:hypothetical protein
MGTYHDEQVLLIKTAMGNRALGWDFRPPSSGRTDKEGADKWEGLEYRLMIEGVRKTLSNIENIVPGYKGQGYEIAGFAWWQGHKDSFTPELIDEYEKNLVNIIRDVRTEFKVPKMPAVIATVGFGGHNMADKFLKILKAQMAVGDPKTHAISGVRWTTLRWNRATTTTATPRLIYWWAMPSRERWSGFSAGKRKLFRKPPGRNLLYSRQVPNRVSRMKLQLRRHWPRLLWMAWRRAISPIPGTTRHC